MFYFQYIEHPIEHIPATAICVRQDYCTLLCTTVSLCFFQSGFMFQLHTFIAKIGFGFMFSCTNICIFLHRQHTSMSVCVGCTHLQQKLAFKIHDQFAHLFSSLGCLVAHIAGKVGFGSMFQLAQIQASICTHGIKRFLLKPMPFQLRKYVLLSAQTVHPVHIFQYFGCLVAHIAQKVGIVGTVISCTNRNIRSMFLVWAICKTTPLCLFAHIQAEVGFATGSSCTEWCLITQTSYYYCYSLQLWRRPVEDPEAKGKGKYRREDQEPEVNLL